MKPIHIWWPVVAWTLAIALLTLPAPPSPVAEAPAHLDKPVHLGLYLGLGWSLGRALWLSGRASRPGTLLALAGGVGFGAVNEWAQRLFPARDPSIADWLTDGAGVALGLALYLWPRSRRAHGVTLPDAGGTEVREEP